VKYIRCISVSWVKIWTSNAESTKSSFDDSLELHICKLYTLWFKSAIQSFIRTYSSCLGYYTRYKFYFSYQQRATHYRFLFLIFFFSPDNFPAISLGTQVVISAIVALLRLIALGFFAFVQWFTSVEKQGQEQCWGMEFWLAYRRQKSPQPQFSASLFVMPNVVILESHH